MSDDEPFDFARYFTRVQRTESWHQMQMGMAAFGHARPGDLVLDVGSGPGRLVAALRAQGVNALGLDGDTGMVRHSRAAFGRLPLLLGRAERLPFRDNIFATVMAGNLLFFLPAPGSALLEMARVCQAGGWVVNWSPSERMSQAAAHHYVAHEPTLDEFSRKHLVNWAGVAENNRRWSAEELEKLFSDAGLAEFASATTLGGLARYARGRKPK